MDSNKKTHRLTPADVESILALRKVGMPVPEIAAKFGVWRASVDYHLRAAGLPTADTGQARLTPEQQAEIVALRTAGETLAGICRATGQKESTVRWTLAKAGVKLAPEQRSAVLRTDPAVVQGVCELRRSGKSVDEVVEATGLSRGSVRWMLHTAGVTVDPAEASARAVRARHGVDVPSVAEVQDVTQRRAAGEKVAEIAAAVGRSVQAVRGLLHREGVLASPETLQRHRRVGGTYRWRDVREVAEVLKMVLLRPAGGDGELVEHGNEGTRMTCRCGAEFEPRIFDFLYGKIQSCGCVKSKPQVEVTTFLRSLGFEVSINDKTITKPLELDAYLPAQKFAVEYCGLYWHGERTSEKYGKDARRRHAEKFELCRAAGARLVTIFADEWLRRRPAVEGYLRAILGAPLARTGARECAVVHRRMPEVAAFLELNHVQGSAGHRAYTLELGGEMVAVLTAALKEGRWHVVRYCVRSGTAVPGGFQRLVAELLRDTGARELVTYSDRRWSRGDLYRRAGWVLARSLPPTYWYFKKGTDTPRWHRSRLRKAKLRRMPVACDMPAEATEWEMALAVGYDRIWDCGADAWELRLG